MTWTCPTDCRRGPTGRHDVERLWCPTCDAAPYRLIAHERRTGQAGHYTYTIEPAPESGAPPVAAGTTDVACPGCGTHLQRR